MVLKSWMAVGAALGLVVCATPERAKAQNFEAGLIFGAAAAMMGAAAAAQANRSRGGRVVHGHRVRGGQVRTVRRPVSRGPQAVQASSPSRDPFASASRSGGGGSRDPFAQPVSGR